MFVGRDHTNVFGFAEHEHVETINEIAPAATNA